MEQSKQFKYINGEQCILPEFFKADKSNIPFGIILESDSVLKYLMNDWKEEFILNYYNQKINLMECIKDRVKHIKTYSIHKNEKNSLVFTNKINTVLNLQNNFLTQEQQTINEQLDALEKELTKLAIKYYVILEEKKKIEGHKHTLVSYDLNFAKKIEEISYKINVYGSHLELETNGSVIVRQISKTHNQFFRCKKAVLNNIKSRFFEDTVFSSLSLMEAFKIENSILLKQFEDKLAQSYKATLKGLFCLTNENQLCSMVTFGLAKSLNFKKYQQKFLRIPAPILHHFSSNLKSKVQETLAEAAPFKYPIYLSSYSTTNELKTRLQLQTEESAELIYIILCRVIIDQSKQKSPNAKAEVKSGEIFYSSIKEAYEVHSPSLVYPEYILICKPILKKEESFSLNSNRIIDINPDFNPLLAKSQHQQFTHTLSGGGFNQANNSSTNLPYSENSTTYSHQGSSSNSALNSQNSLSSMAQINHQNSLPQGHGYKRSSSSELSQNLSSSQNLMLHFQSSGKQNPAPVNGMSSHYGSFQGGVNDVSMNGGMQGYLASTYTQSFSPGVSHLHSHSEVADIIKRINSYLENLNLQQKLIMENIRALFQEFWNRINYQVQKFVHPGMISQRNFSIEELQAQVDQLKGNLHMNKTFTNDLENLKNSRNQPV